MSWTFTADDGTRIESDDTTRTVNNYDAEGNLTESRPFTEEENAALDLVLAEEAAQANSATISTRLTTVDLPAMQAILNQTNADLRADPSQEIKDIARAVRRLTRKVEKILDGTD